MPFDPTILETKIVAENKGAGACTRASAAPLEQKEKISSFAAPGAVAPEGAYPPLWQGASPLALMAHGPRSARFEEPPPAGGEPPEPEETVGESLTERQLAFCDRYVERPVAALAARAAGYAPGTAAKQASRLLKYPAVIRRILELRRKRHLEAAFRRETLMDKLEVVFAQAIERNEFYAAVQALTMQARLARIDEAMPGFRYVTRYANGREHILWDALNRLEQKLSELAVGDFPGAAAAAPNTPFEEARRAEQAASPPPADRAAFAMDRARHRKR